MCQFGINQRFVEVMLFSSRVERQYSPNQPEDKISTNHDVFSIIFLSGKASLYYSSYSYYAEINCHGGCYLVPPVVTYFVEEDISWVVIS